jgi:hypothetical protein
VSNRKDKRTIEDYSFGSIRINGAVYHSDVIVSHGGITQWWRAEGHLLQPVDLEEILGLEPDIVVIGTGYHGAMRVTEDAERLCRGKGVELIARKTNKACTIFNDLMEKGTASVVAALHLTC